MPPRPHVHEAYAGASGPVLVPLTQDVMDPGHWFAEGATLNAAGLVAFRCREVVRQHSQPGQPRC